MHLLPVAGGPGQGVTGVSPAPARTQAPAGQRCIRVRASCQWSPRPLPVAGWPDQLKAHWSGPSDAMSGARALRILFDDVISESPGARGMGTRTRSYNATIAVLRVWPISVVVASAR
jgi:hypothetical protein